jgi:hypothetical protein
MMNRFLQIRLISLAASTLPLLLPTAAPAQPANKVEGLRQPMVMLVLSPAPAPVPALKYRLLPSTADLIPGDAAPIYLRAHGYDDSELEEAWRQITEKSKQWQDLPLKDFPIAEARKFVNLWSGKLQQIEFGTRRKTCDWNYTVPEQRLNIINVLLPDVQSMRQWSRVLALKARVEIAEKQYDEAIRTIETGLAFARHVAEGPFLINGLVGIANAHVILDKVDELIAQPGVPNLYWALTTLPQPLFNLRNQLEAEQKLIENIIPEMTEAELTRPRTDAEWASLVSRIHEGIVKWGGGYSPDRAPGLRTLLGWDLARFKAETLSAARESQKTLRDQIGQSFTGMSEDQIVARYLVAGHRSLRDELFKAAYLPGREALPQLTRGEERLIAAYNSGPLAFFAAILPALRPVLLAELRQDRRVAVLRVIESLRLYAASHDGALPESLSQIKEVPVPEDPASGKPFEYRLNGNSADLSGPQAGMSPPWPLYRITMRH